MSGVFSVGFPTVGISWLDVMFIMPVSGLCNLCMSAVLEHKFVV